MGVLLGLGMATKIYAYMALVLFGVLVCLVVWLAAAGSADGNTLRRHLAGAPSGAALVAVFWLLLARGHLGGAPLAAQCATLWRLGSAGHALP